MLISVIIPTCNRTELLSKCLELLAPSVQTIDIQYEIIVTDDSSDDNSKRYVAEHSSWASWIAGPQKGPAANRNNGAQKAKGEWLVFIDDDCLPQADILKNYQTGITKYSTSLAFEGAILPDNWDLLKKDMAECPVNTNGNCFWTANVCINATVFKQIGRFDETYLMAAQEDQQIKLNIENFTKQPIVFLEHCIVVHPVRFTTIAKQLNKITKASKNFSIYAYKNKEQLGYTSTIQFALKQYRFHLKTLSNLVRKGKLKGSVVSLAWLTYGVPLNVLNFLKYKNLDN